MHKNSFAEGTLVSYAAVVITKILGLVYTIPFYRIIGAQGGFIYSTAYSVYALFLDISTSGIPVAMSILVSEYLAKEKYRSKERAYRLGFQVVSVISVTAFMLLQLFARQIGSFFIETMQEGATLEQVAWAVRSISFSLLVVPMMSVTNGYLEGHKFISVPAASQVIEQLVRILVVLLGSYLVICVMGGTVTEGVCTALAGTALGGLAGFWYDRRKINANRDLFPQGSDEESADPDKVIIGKIIRYCSYIVVISVSGSLYNIIDTRLLITGLLRCGYGDIDVQTIASINSTWAPKICAIINAISTGMTASIAPHMAESFAAGDYQSLHAKLTQAMTIVLTITVPLAIGMIIFAGPVYQVFYGSSAYGPSILVLTLLLNVVSNLTTILAMSMQSMNLGRQATWIIVFGIVLNMSLDLPLLYLFDTIGLAYLGPSVSSVLTQTVVLVLLLTVLRGQIHFSVRRWLDNARTLVVPLAAMTAAVLAVKAFWPIPDTTRLDIVWRLGVYALLGMAVYFPLAARSGALAAAFGPHYRKRLSGWLHRGRKEQNDEER
jgi:O-antigen/teichoic acid export membrane protein